MLTYGMPPDHSGAAKQAITLASTLSVQGVRIFFISQGSSREALAVKRVANFEVFRIYKQSLIWKVIAPARFFWLLFTKRCEFSILHVHGFGYLGKIAVVFGKMFRKPVIIKMTMVGEDDAMSIRQGPRGWLAFRLFSTASHYIAITETFRKSCEAAGLPVSKVSLIPNGVDIARFCPVSEPERQALRTRLGIPADKIVLAYAGLVRPEKGIDFLLDAASKLHGQHSSAMLVLMGPVEPWLPAEERRYADRMLERIKGELRGIVQFVGNVSNVHEFFQASDIFVSASHREGFPNVLLEAMATGLPPVVIEIPGVHAGILRDGTDGVVVPQRDVQAFVRELERLVDQPERRRAIGAAARRKAKEHYSVDRVTTDYLHLYRELVHG